MARLFDVTTTVDATSIDTGSTAQVVYTVTNTTAKPQRGALRPKALDSAQAGWLSVSGDTERDFPPNATHQVALSVKVPADAQVDRFRVRLDALSVTNPDDDYTEGPVVAITVKAAPVPTPKKSMLWLWILIAVVAVVVIGAVVALLMRGRKPPEPVAAVIPADIIGQPYGQARERLEKAGMSTARVNKPMGDAPCGDKVVQTEPAPGATPASGVPVKLVVGQLPYGPDTCKQGYVWRDAFAGDHVCVGGDSRSRAAADNAAHSSRVEVVQLDTKEMAEVRKIVPEESLVAKDGSAMLAKPLDNARLYTVVPGIVISDRMRMPTSKSRCKIEFVERRAGPADRVCVTEATQLATAEENAKAAERRVCPAP